MRKIVYIAPNVIPHFTSQAEEAGPRILPLTPLDPTRRKPTISISHQIDFPYKAAPRIIGFAVAIMTTRGVSVLKFVGTVSLGLLTVRPSLPRLFFSTAGTIVI